MKVMGLIGGTTWLSTIEYYRVINETVNEKLGKTHSAHCILYSVDFEEFITKKVGKWDEISIQFIDITQKLQGAGAEFFILCANTLHIIADELENKVDIPLVHIVDATAEKIQEKHIKKIGLLGTKYTMGEDFYKKRLKEKNGIETIVPSPEDQKIIHTIIIEELAHNIFKPSSKQIYLDIIEKMKKQGAEGIILGCTEIPLLIKEDDINIPSFDTIKIHAQAAVNYALEK